MVEDVEATVSVAEAAKILGRDQDTIRKWCRDDGFGWKPTPIAHWRIPVSRLRPATRPDSKAASQD